MNIVNMFKQPIQPVQPPHPQQPQQPWVPSREEMMRLNALQLAVSNQNATDKVATAKEYYKFLADEMDKENTEVASKSWFQL